MPSDESDTIAALRTWDVIWPHDGFIYPPKWKMWVCVSVQNLWFLRVNSIRYNPPDAALPLALHPFLDRDSWLGCTGDLAEITAYELEEALKKQGNPDRRGLVGSIHPDCRKAALVGFAASDNLSAARKTEIFRECS